MVLAEEKTEMHGRSSHDGNVKLLCENMITKVILLKTRALALTHVVVCMYACSSIRVYVYILCMYRQTQLRRHCARLLQLHCSIVQYTSKCLLL